MSFLEERSDIAICNRALSRVKQQQLSGSLSDPANLNKNAARECNLWYKAIVRQVLSQHHWGLATRRVDLALAPANDLSAQWTYAYLPPSDMAFPVALELTSTGVTAGQISYYAGLNYILAVFRGQPLFKYENGILYSNTPNGALSYVSYDITEQDFNEAVESLVTIFLASQLARSIAKDDKLAESLHNEGMHRMNLEIANNLNMSRQQYGEYITEAEMVRAGASPMLSGLGIFD